MMGYVRSVNSIHLDYLTPLLKWKIMDIRSLMGESCYPLGYSGFRKILRRIEKLGVLKGIRDPFTKRKYIYLSDEGIKAMSGNSKLALHEDDSLYHDAKASEICRKFLSFESVDKVLLDHELNRREIVLPDGVIQGVKNGVSYSAAFEFELTQKSKSRIVGKLKSYLSSSSYDYVSYFFVSEQLCRSYLRTLSDELDGNAMKRIMLFFNTSLLSKSYELKNSSGFFKGNEVNLNELF